MLHKNRMSQCNTHKRSAANHSNLNSWSLRLAKSKQRFAWIKINTAEDYLVSEYHSRVWNTLTIAVLMFLLSYIYHYVFAYWIFLLRLSLTWLLFCNGVINGLCYYQKSVGKIWDSSFDEICRYNDSLKLVVISDRFYRKTHPIFCIRISESNITPIYYCI